MSLSHILEALAGAVLEPLVLGGPLKLIPPIGPETAAELGEGRRISDDGLRSRIDVARVRQARLLAPIDALPDISPPEWAMVAALNDLLQVTNHLLSGPFTRKRHTVLLEKVRRLLSVIPVPRTSLELIVRHATFARIMELRRTDTVVRSWAGVERFRGAQPTKSATMWRNLRRVEVQALPVSIVDMCEGLESVDVSLFQTTLTTLVSLSPLTDIATASREAPAFFWSKATIGAVSYPIGRALALRALRRSGLSAGVAALHRALMALPRGKAFTVGESFVNEATALSQIAEMPELRA